MTVLGLDWGADPHVFCFSTSPGSVSVGLWTGYAGLGSLLPPLLGSGGHSTTMRQMIPSVFSLADQSAVVALQRRDENSLELLPLVLWGKCGSELQ